MKVAELVEEGLRCMDGIEALGLRLGDGLLLDGHNLESGLVDLGEDGAGVALADRVGLDDAEGALRHVILLLDDALDSIVMARCGWRSFQGLN